MKPHATLFAGLLSLAARAGRADPTWPAATDEMEEIIYQLHDFRARLFADAVTPCSNEASGPGRVTASEWLRVAFHDMSTANHYFGTGGLDASIQFELNNGENTGPGHTTALTWYSNFFSSRATMSDLIALGTCASVRSCGGPVVPLRLGRIDASAAGSNGVPQPQNSVVTFRQQFDRMGFTPTEMIQVTACGHTLGSVHSAEFPDLVPPGTGVNGQVPLDSSAAGFDNKVVTEFVDGTTQNPLVRGPAIAVGRNSDFKVFNSDGNATLNAMSSPAAFASVCQTVLQKMIDTVPPGVVLTDPIAPYMVKPVDMQLTLNQGAASLLLTGNIRVRTTNLPKENIRDVTFTWKDRNGGSNCGSSGCSLTTTLQGVGSGLDDTFGFFPISTTISASAGISSFTVKVNLVDGSSQFFDNNGNSYPLSDAVILQKPQSCLLQSSGALTVTALVRNDVTATPVTLGVEFLVPRGTSNGNPVPALNKATVAMTKGDCAGPLYTFYTASYSIAGGKSFNARISVTAGTAATDDFNRASDLAGSCIAFAGGTCASSSAPPSSASSSSTGTGSSVSTASSSITSSSSSSSSSSSASPSPTLMHKPALGGYVLKGCWTEGSGGRALTGASFAYDSMTLESCMGNCTGFDLFAAEYGRECYCGSALSAGSVQAPPTDCNMVCAGNQYEFCGAGNRLELYSTTATRSASTSSTPTATLAVRPTVGAYVFVGCQTEATSGRALTGPSFADNAMTLEACAASCTGYTYFGTEYGRECYCGMSPAAGSVPAILGDCSMTCSGNPLEYCGAGNRLELYKLASAVSSTSSSATSSTLGIKPTVSPFTFVGCWTEGTGARALSAKSYESAAAMTLESCAAFCAGYRYFGAEYASQCFCGNALHPTSSNASLGDCSMACTGNQYEYCGAGNRLELYRDDTVTVPTGPSQPATVSPNWGFYSCVTEASAGRALAAKSYADDAMTLETCGVYCAGYTFFGAEYARECYCGNAFASGATNTSLADCSMTCAGNGTEYCGGGGRLSVYVAHA
ncbi:hypothetical protein B0T24DRAFT_529707 [Lasiosphaeria ovina]|uniref:Uncharacterized protein n=1 Tax=Lasiosphaeria ovina TaxID=92902 RepID=A0AAE0N7P0_9PEZI|nr:hypothetical protein B0T24DRAFT_529707 [Lasiosphaeria ovina]